MSKSSALTESLRRQCKSIADLDAATFARRWQALGPTPDGKRLYVFGRPINRENLHANLSPTENILLCRLLSQDIPPAEKYPLDAPGSWCSFRAFPGGEGYWGPFRGRVVEPFIAAIAEDPRLLERCRSRLSGCTLPFGDQSCAVPLIGRLHLGLVHHQGDEEFPNELDLLFPLWLPHFLGAEEALALCSHLRQVVVGHTCETCLRCGVCAGE